MKIVNKPYEKDCKDWLRIELGLNELDIIAYALKEYEEILKKRIKHNEKLLWESSDNEAAEYTLRQDKPYLEVLKEMLEVIKELGGLGFSK